MGTRYHVHVPPQNSLHRREIELRIKMLREFVLTHERWFNDKDEVLKYMNDVIGIRSKTGRRVTPALLYIFRKKMNFPYAEFARRTIPVTSNVLIMAWLWSLRVYGATKPHNPHTRDLADAVAHLL